MIPRFKPSIGRQELAACLRHEPGAVERFERDFAAQFGAAEGVAFAYGRSGLFALCKVLGLEQAEVVLPAYTCSVVAHAATVSGNLCRFVDINLRDYNMDPAQVEAAIGERTRMVIATHLFGFPADVDQLQAVVERAGRKYGHKIWLIQDCAHAFGARWNGKLVCQAGDVALFGFGVSKMMTSIFGGLLTTDNLDLATKLREWRDLNFRKTSWRKTLSRSLYLIATAAAFSKPCYALVRWLEDETPLLDRLTKAYHLDGMIRLPPDYAEKMDEVEAQVGLAQLGRYQEFESRRRENANYYHRNLHPPSDWIMPPDVEGATYSHFPVRVLNREATLRQFLGVGIQLGQLIEYSLPHLSEYCSIAQGEFPNSLLCSQHMINLPVHPSLSEADRGRIVEQANRLPKLTLTEVAKS